MPVEDPMFAMFRKMLLPAIGQEYQKAQTPVYGDAQKAQFLNDANGQFNNAADNLTGNLARRGALSSGAAAGSLEPLEGARAGNVSNFFSQIPFLNEQARSSRVNNLLGLATNFLGRDPIGQTTTSQGTNTGNSNTSMFGPAFSNGLSGNVGGLLGLGGFGLGPFGSLGDIFKPKPASGGSGGGYGVGDPYGLGGQ